LLRIFKRIKVKKFSGFLFLLNFLNDKSKKKKKILFVDPSINDSKLNSMLLVKKGFKNFFNYVAPIYNSKKSYQDKKLFDLINKTRPEFIVINISGLKQEYLAYIIIKKIKFKLSILCLGGAISFITKTQAPITPFFDKYYMGWLVRIIFSPNIFIRRTIRSISLIKFFI
jgi:UDP-N-acetyl-D-mannosaminuronic acid transferase (WecB/TagA/CpsF family)